LVVEDSNHSAAKAYAHIASQLASQISVRQVTSP